MPRQTTTDKPPAAPPSAPPRFRVTLHCPTPVAHPELDIEADDETAAWNQFCTANGISGSDHPRKIVPIVSGP